MLLAVYPILLCRVGGSIDCLMYIKWHKPQIYFPWWTQHENIPNTHVSAYCHNSLWSTFTYVNMKTVSFYVQTAVNLQRKSLGTPECKNLGNMLIDSIWLNVQAKFVLQNDVILLWIRYGYMKVSHRPPVHAANLVVNTGKSIRGWRIIIVASDPTRHGWTTFAPTLRWFLK